MLAEAGESLTPPLNRKSEYMYLEGALRVLEI